MAIIKTTDTRELAGQIHEATRDLLDELSWAAKRIWHTTGEIRRADTEFSSWGWAAPRSPPALPVSIPAATTTPTITTPSPAAP